MVLLYIVQQLPIMRMMSLFIMDFCTPQKQPSTNNLPTFTAFWESIQHISIRHQAVSHELCGFFCSFQASYLPGRCLYGITTHSLPTSVRFIICHAPALRLCQTLGFWVRLSGVPAFNRSYMGLKNPTAFDPTHHIVHR